MRQPSPQDPAMQPREEKAMPRAEGQPAEEKGGIGLALLAWIIGIPGLIILLLLFV